MKIEKISRILIIVFAIGGAFASHATIKRVQAPPLVGYISTLEEGLCSISVQCGYGESICTAIIYGEVHQAYGKILPDLPICPIFLFRHD